MSYLGTFLGHFRKTFMPVMKPDPKVSTISPMPRYRAVTVALVLALIIALLNVAVPAPRTLAAQPTPTAPLPEPHFRLPFETPPGASTWYVSQFYGNTPLAYDRRVDWYSAGQGLHFGVDFAARCGTPVVAIGDGEVWEVDNLSHGAAPHNLTILHPNGYASFYGHLLEQPTLRFGDKVTAGQRIALTGDPDETCKSRPHLHLEIRDKTMGYAYNPVLLIDTDWDSLALFGPFQKFSRNLDNPRQWVTPFDQPMVDFGAGLLNDYDRPWPPEDW